MLLLRFYLCKNILFSDIVMLLLCLFLFIYISFSDIVMLLLRFLPV